MLIGRDSDFIAREIAMYFSDTLRFTRDIFTVTSASDTKVSYEIEVAERFSTFKDDLSPEKVFEYIDQIVDDVKESITGDGVEYHKWNDILFLKDTTFDTTFFETPKPLYIYKTNQKVGHLGIVLFCIAKSGEKFYLTLRDTKGQILKKTHADIDDLNDATAVAFRSLSLAAFPLSFFEEDAVLRKGISDNAADIDTLETKMNAVYPRVVGDDSLLSNTYRKALKNELDLMEILGYTDAEQVYHPGFTETTDGRLDTLEDKMDGAEYDIDNAQAAITDIKAYPEYNMTGISPFYLFRRGDYSLSNRAYDPVFYDDITFADASSVAWQHVVEHRMKEMPMRLLKDTVLKAAVDRLVREANEQSITGNRIELGCCTNTYFLFADDATNWTPSASYTRKEAITLISFVPARFGGGAFKPALYFQVLGGHLDGGIAAGDFSGGFCLIDKSETDTPDYHWYRYGDNANINGMALADVKVQYH